MLYGVLHRLGSFSLGDRGATRTATAALGFNTSTGASVCTRGQGVDDAWLLWMYVGSAGCQRGVRACGRRPYRRRWRPRVRGWVLHRLGSFSLGDRGATRTATAALGFNTSTGASVCTRGQGVDDAWLLWMYVGSAGCQRGVRACGRRPYRRRWRPRVRGWVLHRLGSFSLGDRGATRTATAALGFNTSTGASVCTN